MTYKSDEALQSEVMFQLGWDSRVNQTEVGVTVRRRVVTLTGTVGSYAEKLAAQEAAHRVPCALDVVNNIEVRSPEDPRCGDAEIAHALRHGLEWNVLVPADKIQFAVVDGWVTLRGSVEYYSERIDAERAVSLLPGVRGVTNNIQVVSPIEPERVKFLIEDALERRAEREANRIRVEVDEGAVTLSGPVNSWDEKKAILGIVSHAPGVTAVHDRLIMDLYKPGFEFVKAK
jgi:hyperosmotically inducible protein